MFQARLPKCKSGQNRKVVGTCKGNDKQGHDVTAREMLSGGNETGWWAMCMLQREHTSRFGRQYRLVGRRRGHLLKIKLN